MGVGTALLAGLEQAAEAEKYWTLDAQIFARNQASLALHKKQGFRQIGYREKVGQRKGIWHDVILLEKRSSHTGGPGLPTRVCTG
ncbi:MAG: L-amino acid N-acyltransferase YncA [Candidatus Promineifilaceae bacterium]|jgi:L-amino acid N-acyltransferase YncA